MAREGKGITVLPATHTHEPHLPFVRKRSPDGATQLRWQTSSCSLLLIYRPRKDERLIYRVGKKRTVLEVCNSRKW